jgi:hypothetical protein
MPLLSAGGDAATAAAAAARMGGWRVGVGDGMHALKGGCPTSQRKQLAAARVMWGAGNGCCVAGLATVRMAAAAPVKGPGLEWVGCLGATTVTDAVLCS